MLPVLSARSFIWRWRRSAAYTEQAARARPLSVAGAGQVHWRSLHSPNTDANSYKFRDWRFLCETVNDGEKTDFGASGPTVTQGESFLSLKSARCVIV